MNFDESKVNETFEYCSPENIAKKALDEKKSFNFELAAVIVVSPDLRWASRLVQKVTSNLNKEILSGMKLKYSNNSFKASGHWESGDFFFITAPQLQK